MDGVQKYRKVGLITSLEQEMKMLQDYCDKFNAQLGKDYDYDCPICKNKAWIAIVQDGEIKMKPCECQAKRRAFKNYRNLVEVKEDKSMNCFHMDTPTARKMFEVSQQFITQKEKWLYLGGQSGSGKTHICKALEETLANRGFNCKYFNWRENINELKIQFFEDKAQYQMTMHELKSADYLFIDDLFKGKITETDTNIAYEIINSRYDNNKLTVITSELYMSELKDVDEAIQGRIYEKSLQVIIERKDENNYRLR
jgi:DNA replication protein DnaC